MSETSQSLWKYFDSVWQMFRGPKACPWLKVQTHETLMPYIKEELGEFIHALKGSSKDEAIDELGDIWLQCTLHTLLLAEESGRDASKIFDSWREKLERRHPHVFDPTKNTRTWTYDEVLSDWKQMKDREKKAHKSEEKAPKTASFRELSSSISELVRAQKIGERSRAFNFDWAHVSEIIEKIEEEWSEFKAALKERTSEAEIEEEMGDLLFSIAQAARHLHLSAEQALSKASDKFVDRFSVVEKLLQERSPQEARGDWMRIPRDRLEALWTEAKKRLKTKA